jgi:hypothetical protein
MSAKQRAAFLLAIGVACGSGTRAPASRDRDVSVKIHRQPLAVFVDSVRAVSTADHEQIAAALDALADAIEPIARDHGPTARLRALASELRDAGANEEHGAVVVDALGNVLEALLAVVGDAKLAYARAVYAYERLEREEPLARQTDRVRDVLAAIANTIAAAQGKAPPFASAIVADGARDTGDLRARATRVQHLVEDAAAAPSTDVAIRRTIDVLRALADAIRSASTSTDVALLASPVSFAASRLEQVGYVSFDRVDLVKGALETSIDALSELAQASEGSTLAIVIEAARVAVRGIEERTTYAFERAQVQDALRSVATAFVVFASGDRR